VQKFFDWILDWIWPRLCVVCGREGELCCPACSQKLNIIYRQVCPVCREGGDGRVCPDCCSKSDLDGLLVALENSETAAILVHKYKYRDFYRLDDYLVERLVTVFTRSGLMFDLISFVPLARQRLWWRGYNQAERLASGISRVVRLGLANCLRRQKFTRSQVGLNRRQRQENVTGVFQAINRPKWRGKNILLVDDVCSSQATLEECAKELKRHGANVVWGLVLLRGV